MASSTVVVAASSAALTADGTSVGYVTIASTSTFFVGALVYLSSTTQVSQAFRIADIPDATRIGLRANNGINYGHVDVSAYLVADSAHIWQDSQLVEGQITLDGSTLAVTNETISGNLTVTGANTVSGVETINNNLVVTGNASIGGNTTLTGTLGVGGATILSSTLSVAAATTLSTTLGVTGKTTLNGGEVVHFNPQAGAAYIALASDQIIGMSDDAIRTVSIPGGSPAGTLYTIKDTSGSVTVGHTITITTTAGNIEGIGSFVITPGTNTSVSVFSDGTNYWIMCKL